MKIGYSDNSAAVNPAGPQKAGQAAGPAGSRTAAPAAGAPAAAAAADTVTVSSLARTLKSSETEGMDMEKVDAVRAAIDKGTYKVNAEAIADKLLANAQEMITRTRA